MKTHIAKHKSNGPAMSSRLGAFLVGLAAALSALPAASVDISNSPLSVGANIPGNLSIVPSVEFPTLISVANFGDYNPARRYVGYFDPAKCYRYVFDVLEPNRHFAPDSMAGANNACAGSLWSGSYMNWAATQTIDPFRSALTGGYRVRDTTTQTWLEKAKADRDGGESTTANFPRRTYPGSANTTAVNNATPATWGTIRTRVDGLDNLMRFTGGSNGTVLAANDAAVAYNPAIHTLVDNPAALPADSTSNIVYEVSVRVAVCVAGMLESNCKQYSGAAKPEGLIQEYSDRLTYSSFGYLNNGNAAEPDGGVLRARQKFVGPLTYFPGQSFGASNARREWDPTTGVQLINPDPADALATDQGAKAIDDSGVINYLNKFGQMNTGRRAKSFDNVSELYYAALRYFKNQGNVPEYSALSGDKYQLADGFPVITNWDDPIKYSCQTNVILGIGDTNTWRDKNLPGATSGAGEINAKPAAVAADTSVDVVADLGRIYQMEGKSAAEAQALATASHFNREAHNNSAYIAALAYGARTRDIRPTGAPNELPGRQTISTYWVDVIENRGYKTPATNQYWLATKYGGFTVPTGYNPDTNITPLLDSQWWANGEYVNPTGANYKRPRNFYEASEASKMVESLRTVFAQIVAELRGSGGSFAANSTKLETGARTFQAQFFTGSWRGELSAYDVNSTTGALTPAWNAGSVMPAWASRKIFINAGGTYRPFTFANLSPAQSSALGSQAVVDYLRGDRSNEAPAGALRTRQSVLGDIVNSQPTFVGRPNDRLFYGQEFPGASTYGAFVSAMANRTPVVYVGANDGMLHGFNADTGVETYAFVPDAAIGTATNGLKNYTSPDYVHRYYVDGETTVADVYTGGAWRTVLVGTMGRGGRGVYALDVTNPADVKFLWERGATDIPALGNVLGKPIIAQLARGDWFVLLGNGPNSSGNDAQLVTINIATGNHTTLATGASSGNGLAGVNVWSTGVTDFADTVYAGDMTGAVWKVTNLTATTPTVLKLFQAQSAGGVAQPITAAPLVSKNPGDGKTWVYFGTGQYLNASDLSNKSVQTWYGLIDDGTAVSGRSQLAKINILAEVQVGQFVGRVIDERAQPGPRGWYVDLVSPVNGEEGERMVVPNFFQGRVLIGTARIPDTTNACNPSGKGFVMAINPFTGGRLTQSFFDMTGDGTFDHADLVNGLPVSGIGSPSGPNNPIFIGDIMQTNLDDASSTAIKTNTSVLTPVRVSWREIVGN